MHVCVRTSLIPLYLSRIAAALEESLPRGPSAASQSLRRASARPEVEPAGGLAPHRGNDCSQAVPRHVLEPDATLGVDRLLVGTPTRLALQVSE